MSVINNEFIEKVAVVAVKDWMERKIMLPSVVIAQAILESDWGESELAKFALALFGIKKNGWTGKTYVKAAGEQRPDGSYYVVNNTEWRAYDSWDESIIDHNTYIATRELTGGKLRYEAIIGNTDYKEVCKLLKSCSYATDINYPDKLINIIETYNLTVYDKAINNEVSKMLKVAIDAGHGRYTAGKRCMKKLDANETREWVLNDRIADKLEAKLENYNCEVLRVDDTTGLTDVSLANRVKKANNWGADVYISIHHNAGILGFFGGGTIVFYYSSKAERKTQAQALYNAIVKQTGLVGNRSSKVKKYGYYVIKNTKMAAFLIENGFMDSKTDVPVILSEAHADKTVQGLLNFLVDEYKLAKISNDAITDYEDKVATSFKVKVTVDSLNIRASAGTKHAIKGAITDHGIYTIVETYGSWGKLKSGAGWINISSKYVSRV